MNGVVTQVRDKMLSMTSHAMLRSSDGTGVIPPEFDPAPYLANIPELIAYAPYVQGAGTDWRQRTLPGRRPARR